MNHILRSSYGLRHCQVPKEDPPLSSHDLQRLRRFYPKLKSVGGHGVRGYVDLHENGTNFRYFTLMRDPVKLCASRFQYKVQVSQKKNMVFEQWIERDWTRNHQTKWIAGVDDVSEAIRMIKEKNMFVGLTERFDESMVLLKALLANDLNISYRRVNVAPRDAIKERLLSTERSRQLLIESQKKDLELYDFVREELYPSYQRAYGPSLEADVAHYRQTQSHNFNYWNLTLCRLKNYVLWSLLYPRRRGVRVILDQ